MPPKPSRRVEAVQPPVIPIVGGWIRETPGTISLGQGLVAWGPPPEAMAAARAFGDDPDDHRYGPVEGQPALVSALEAKLAAENGILVRPDSRVFVTAGGNMAFVNAVLALADPGDEIVLQAPYYFNHEMAVVLAGCRPVIVQTDSAYQLRPDAIRRAFSPRTRAVVTISPNNPTGAVYDGEALRAVNALCAEHGVYHVHDEAYEYFTYDGARHVSPAAFPGAAPHTISLFSLSKAYGFASWRVGYMVVPASLFDAVNKIQDTNLICAPLVSQAAALAALGVGRAWSERHLPSLAAVRGMVDAELSRVGELCEAPTANGAFYVLLRVRTAMSSLALVERLVREHRVAVIPGTAFGVPDGDAPAGARLRGPVCSVRLSYGALDPDTVAEGMRRLVGGLQALAG